ncbi:hypothetical protein ACFORG_03005 [Lutimaribacter marinistellae]|uniref:DnaA N-terminal domain-containing protein n=1 Tax=Lutimaribacter marinistellae TaxID=1820329 RepID=A0ABV7TDI9_9RHOB
MQMVKPVGRNAPALKYDILSALGVHALAGDKHHQRLVLRLMVLITTRYNWQSNELSIGRAEIARLWSVDERTVKREMAKLRNAGWLQVKRPAARGRVAVYELSLSTVLAATREIWGAIGTDFEARMDQGKDEPSQSTDPKVVPLRRKPAATVEGLWGDVLKTLATREADLTETWFSLLSEAEHRDGRVLLLAPSQFIADYISQHLGRRLLAAYTQHDPTVRQVVVVAGV